MSNESQNAAGKGTLQPLVGLADCLAEINNALNYWYPLKGDASEDERNARHVRLFQFRDRLAKQLKANAPAEARASRRLGKELFVTVQDVINHLQTLDPALEVWVTWDESGEYWPATEPQGRVDWVHQETRTGGRTRWECSYEEGKGKPVCVLLSNTKVRV